MFGYVRGGYVRVLGTFGEHSKEKGVEIYLNTKITNVEKLANGQIKLTAGIAKDAEKKRTLAKELSLATPGNFQTENFFQNPAPSASLAADSFSKFDSVILTCPSNVAAKICPQFSEDEKAKFENTKYQGIVCASVLMNKSLSNFYVTNITDETPFTGIIEMSALVDKKEFGGNALVYLPKYVAPDDELFEKSDAEVEDVFLTALEKMYPHLSRADVKAFKISRVRNVFPIPTLNYSANLPPVETSLRNVFVVNSAQITNGTLNVNEAVQLAERFFKKYFAG